MSRNIFFWFVLALLAAATVWAVSFRPETKADFTFINPAECESLDPTIITGQTEGRVADALFEGLTAWDPDTLVPRPGMAESWTISDDKLVYTFKIRADAKWSDGTPLTAHDFEWTHRRTLDPLTAAEYAYQLFYVKNAEQYASGQVKTGDKVEVELNTPPDGAPPHARGKILRGTLANVSPPFSQKATKRTYSVEINGQFRSFTTDTPDDFGGCKEVLLDFREVGCKALDDRTYRMTLRQPTSFFLTLTGMFPLYPVNRQCIEEYGFPEWTKPGKLVSNGPFKLEERRLRDRTRLVKNEHFWDRDNVKLNTVDVMIVESDTTGLNMYLKGQVDWITTVPTTIVRQLREKFPDQLQPKPFFQSYFYRFNVTRKPFNDPRVRKALALAVDKRAIVESITRAGEQPARSFVPPVIKNYPGFKTYESALCGEYDPKAAKKLLAEAGYPGGEGFPKVAFLYNSDEGHKMIAELVQQQWKQNLGIDIDPQNQEWSSYLVNVRNLEYDIARAGWVGDYLDPDTFLNMFVTDGGNNETGWSNKDYDDLIDQADREPDATKRLQLMHDAERILMDELPIIPIYFGVSKNMVKPYVRGIYGNVLDWHPLGRISIDQKTKDAFLSNE